DSPLPLAGGVLLRDGQELGWDSADVGGRHTNAPPPDNRVPPRTSRFPARVGRFRPGRKPEAFGQALDAAGDDGGPSGGSTSGPADRHLVAARRPESYIESSTPRSK